MCLRLRYIPSYTHSCKNQDYSYKLQMALRHRYYLRSQHIRRHLKCENIIRSKLVILTFRVCSRIRHAYISSNLCHPMSFSDISETSPKCSDFSFVENSPFPDKANVLNLIKIAITTLNEKKIKMLSPSMPQTRFYMT